MHSSEFSCGYGGDGTVPRRHGEVGWLRYKGKGEFGQAGGAVNGEADVVGKDVFDQGREGLWRGISIVGN